MSSYASKARVILALAWLYLVRMARALRSRWKGKD
jgi:hypothetical protein